MFKKTLLILTFLWVNAHATLYTDIKYICFWASDYDMEKLKNAPDDDGYTFEIAEGGNSGLFSIDNIYIERFMDAAYRGSTTNGSKFILMTYPKSDQIGIKFDGAKELMMNCKVLK